jgi:TPR repeat protein
MYLLGKLLWTSRKPEQKSEGAEWLQRAARAGQKQAKALCSRYGIS